MEHRGSTKVMGWFLPLKLAQYILLLAVVLFWMNFPEFMQLQIVLYSICTLGFTILLAADKRHHFPSVTATLIGLQLLFELVIESSIVYSTGNINSPFSALFILTIVSAALVYRLIGTLLLASAVSTAFAFIIWLGLGQAGDSELSMRALRTIFSAQDSVFYSIFLHILIFYLVAFIAGFLAERLRERDRQLEDTSIALRKARLETDDILRHLNSGLLTVDNHGHVIYFNRAAERILGYREEVVKGLHCDEVFAERMPQLAECLVDGYREGIQHPRREVTITGNDGSETPLGMSTSVLRDEKGEMRGIIAIFSDLTDAKRLEAKVRAADRLAAVGELSASIAHEIRNPLAAISGSVELLKKDLTVTDENERLMDLIVKESDRLTEILTEFLSYARIDRADYHKVELCHLITEVIQILYHHKSYSRDIEIRVETDESYVYVVGDEGLLKQLMLNLAVNACEALAGKVGQVIFRVVVNKDKGTAELYLQDNGPGIDAEHMKRIYEPFYSTKKEGTGLGLAIVHRICSALNVDICVDSQVGEGTTFLVELRMFRQVRDDLAVESNTTHLAHA